MYKLLRFSLTLASIILLAFLIGLIGIATFVNPNELKPQIISAVQKYTGRQLDLKGNMQWSFFPRLGLELQDAALSNPPGFGRQPFAQIKQALIQVRLLPLLKKRVEVSKLILRRPTLHLVKTPENIGNWERWGSKTSEKTASKNPKLPTGREDTIQSFAMLLANLEIQQGRISYQDQSRNQYYEACDFQLEGGLLSRGQKFPLKVQFHITTDKQRAEWTAIKLTGQVTANAAQQQLQLDRLKLEARLHLPASGKKPSQQASWENAVSHITLQTDIKLDLKAQTLKVDPFIADLDGNQWLGRLSGTHLLSAPQFIGKLSSPQLRWQRLSLQKVNTLLVFKESTLTLKPITAKLYAGTYLGDLQLTLGKVPRITTQGELRAVDAGALLRDLATFTHVQATGIANATLQLSTIGSQKTDILKNLNGKGQFALKEGILKGVDMGYWWNFGKSLVKKQPLPSSETDTHQTLFKTLTASFTAQNGVICNQDLQIQSGQLSITGKGLANLPTEQLDFLLNTQALHAGGTPDGLSIPIRVSGPFSKLRIRPVVEQLAKDAFRKEIQKQLQKIDLSNLSNLLG